MKELKITILTVREISIQMANLFGHKPVQPFTGIFNNDSFTVTASFRVFRLLKPYDVLSCIFLIFCIFRVHLVLLG
jgi:hypothetical protein